MFYRSADRFIGLLTDIIRTSGKLVIIAMNYSSALRDLWKLPMKASGPSLFRDRREVDGAYTGGNVCGHAATFCRLATSTTTRSPSSFLSWSSPVCVRACPLRLPGL